LLSAESDFELQSVALADIGTQEAAADLILLAVIRKSVIEVLTTLKALRPGVDVIVTGCNVDDAAILKAISAGQRVTSMKPHRSANWCRRFEPC